MKLRGSAVHEGCAHICAPHRGRATGATGLMRAGTLAGVLRVGVIALLATGRAQGQEQTVAESLFRDARKEMRGGDYAAACPKLKDSQRLDPSPGTLLNLAICNEPLG